MNINNQLGLATHPAPKFLKNIDKQLGFIGGDGQAMLFNADGGEYWAKKAQPNTSDDTLLMLNEDSNFLNANAGSGGNAKTDKETYVATATYQKRLNDLKEGLLKKTITHVDGQQPIKYNQGDVKSLNKYLFELGRLKEEEEKDKRYYEGQLTVKENNVTEAGQKIRTSKEYRKRRDLNQALWYSDNAIAALKGEIESVTKEIKTATEKLDSDAFAKAKSSNTIVAYTEYIKNFPTGLSVDKANQAIDEIKKAQKLKELEDAKKNASPEEKKQIDSEIDRLLGVSSGTTGRVATRMFLYGGVALVAIYGLYRVFKGNTASA
jgi:hypothetical protein